jgi:amino acid adenylation domain-containing protein
MRIKNVLQYLEQTAQRLPDKVAFSDGEGGASLTFSELLDRARRIGSCLCRAGLTGKRVAILMDRHPAAVAAMLGAVYAGAVYVPLDAAMPKERMGAILESCRASAVICDEQHHAAAPYGLPLLLAEDMISQGIDEADLSRIRSRQIDTEPMYIIFTSGSTGTPKGVVGCHRAVIDYGEALMQMLSLDESAVLGCQSPLYFDAPLKELLATLMLGATTYLIPKKLFSFPVLLMDYLNDNGVNTICWVSSALSTVAALGALEARPPLSLKTVVFGSERLPMGHYRAWRKTLPDATFYQLYGPTEATGMSCVWRADRELSEHECIPIGAPMDNTGLLLIDDNGQEILPALGAESAVGEMYLRGSCLTLGYDNNPEQTARAFVQNPTHSDYPEVVYRTGDLAYFNAQGELVFVGRRDGQIKRMGHRIEPGEIEACAHRVEGVALSACVVTEQTSEMVLFYTGEADEKVVMTALADSLPRYYLPARVIRLETMPAMPNGKIDRRALAKEGS